MIRTSIALIGLLTICLFHLFLSHTSVAQGLPDLSITKYEFVSNNDKSLRVLVVNDGKATSKPCRLELAIRKVNGSAVTRSTFETIPVIAA